MNFAINTPIEKLENILKKAIQIQFQSLEIFTSKHEFFIEIENETTKLKNIIEELSKKFNSNANNSFIINFNESNALFNPLISKMNELENKVVDEYIWEKYQKHISENNNENIEKLLSDVKYLEKSLYDFLQDNKSKYFLLIKECDDKIQTSFDKIKNSLLDICLFLEDTNKNMNNELKNLENLINSKETNKGIKFEEKPIYSKFDFILNEKDTNIYKIKILKSNKIQLENPDNQIKEKTDNKSLNLMKLSSFQNGTNYKLEKPKLFKDKFLFLNQKDIYQIISKLYSYNLIFLDKSHYDLDEEKEKLTAMDLSYEILSYNEENEEIKTKFNQKYNEIIDTINKKILNIEKLRLIIL